MPTQHTGVKRGHGSQQLIFEKPLPTPLRKGWSKTSAPLRLLHCFSSPTWDDATDSLVRESFLAPNDLLFQMLIEKLHKLFVIQQAVGFFGEAMSFVWEV